MEIQGNNQWVIIPNDKGEYGEPIFLSTGSTLISNYDDIKVLNGLGETELIQPDEKAIYEALIGKQIVFESVDKIVEKCSELKISADIETKYFDDKMEEIAIGKDEEIGNLKRQTILSIKK